MRRIISLFALVIALAASSSPLRVSLLTCSEGGEIYELEGHSAIRIVHPYYGDFIVNWGVFDFNSPGFVYRFVKGETDYMAAPAETQRFIESYRRQGRTVREQVLRLDSRQAEKLVSLAL
ncbi:MAG: DUF4105 domain-containing protein, partial [Duncaniella sp.]|nr:DUF4105 domain-containing protein [Duncaniella sp.]